MEVKAAVARTIGSPLLLEGLILDEPRDDEILVRLVAAGVSHLDLRAVDGGLSMAFPFVPGAEAAGIVERIGNNVVHVAPGDAVVTCHAACGDCACCLSGHREVCESFDRLNLAGRRTDRSSPFVGSAVGGFFFGQSAFATHILCRASSAVKVGATAPLEVLAGVGGDILHGVGTVYRGFHLSQGDSLAVVGADALGLAGVMMAKALEADPIIVADPDEARRKLAEECGATVSVHAPDALADAARSLTGDGVHFALETTGDAMAEDACRASVRHGGVCAFARPVAHSSAGGRPAAIPVDAYATPDVLIRKLVALHDKGRFPLDRLINFFPFEHINDALDALRSRDVVKPIVRFSLGTFGDLDRAREEGAVRDPPDDPQNEDDESQRTPEKADGVTS